MARFDEMNNANAPAPYQVGDSQAYAHYSDHIAARYVAARLQGLTPAGTFTDLAADSAGNLVPSGTSMTAATFSQAEETVMELRKIRLGIEIVAAALGAGQIDLSNNHLS